MNKDHHYRKGTLNDLEQLQNLGLEAYGQFKSVLTEEHWKTMASNLGSADTYKKLFETAQCFVCENKNEIIGMVFLIPHGNPTTFFQEDWAYIRLLGIDPKFGGKGIGKALTQMCIDAAKTVRRKNTGITYIRIP